MKCHYNKGRWWNMHLGALYLWNTCQLYMDFCVISNWGCPDYYFLTGFFLDLFTGPCAKRHYRLVKIFSVCGFGMSEQVIWQS